MRASLAESIQVSPLRNDEGYAKGSIVVCTACGYPIYRLDRTLFLGDRGGRSANAFKPMRPKDLDDLADRSEIEAGVRAVVMAMDALARATYCHRIAQPRPGDQMRCPHCHQGFPFVRAVDRSECLDYAATISLHTIPPRGTRAWPLKRRWHGLRAIR